MAQAEREPKGDANSVICTDPPIYCKAGWSGRTCENACPAACASGCNACGRCDIVPSPTPTNSYPRLACAQPVPVPAACQNVGQCSWYGGCLQHSTSGPCPDIAAVMQAKCNEYQTLEPSLTTTGQQWSKYVRGCLQSQLGELWAADTFGTVQCDVIQSEFFDKHLPCYLDGPVSFCDLSTMDTLKIMSHAGSILVSSHWWSALSSGARLQARCAASYFQVNVHRRQNSRLLLQADVDVESDLRRFLQAIFGPQGWRADITSINSSALALGFLPASQTSPPPAGLDPFFVASALTAWANTSIGSQFRVGINGDPPFNMAAGNLLGLKGHATDQSATESSVAVPIMVVAAVLLVIVGVALFIRRVRSRKQVVPNVATFVGL